jgi:hypothetical protein
LQSDFLGNSEVAFFFIHPVHHSLQGGYQKQQDALTTCFTIEEVINPCLDEKEKVYVAYTDISKAFNTMGINSMLFKLYHNKGIYDKPGDLLETGILIRQSLCVLKGKVLEHTLFNKGQGKGVFLRHGVSWFSLMI